MSRILIYTDGSYDFATRIGGWAFVIVGPESGHFVPASGGKLNTTNNVMELTAILNAMAWLQLQSDPPATIFSDSQYAVNAVNSWAQGWEKKGWIRKGGPIKNLDLIKALLSSKRDLPHLKLKWVKGHNGDFWNGMADKLANQARMEMKTAPAA